MRVYYRSTDVVITDEVFAIRNPVDMRFRLERVRGAHIVNDDPPARVISAGCIVGIPALAVVAGSQLHSFWAWTVALTVAVLASTVIAVRRTRSPRTSELRATYGELDVTLFRSTDPVVFGQVRRALSRALDNRQPAAI